MWRVELDDKALKDLRSLGRVAQSSILKYLEEKIATNQDPRRFGKALSGDMKKLWRYRVGDYRIVCSIEKNICRVLVLSLGHRKSIYQ